jgi:hypothetical protein
VTTLFNNGNASASPVLNGTTIFDDLEDDDLTGAAGDDWFITHGGDQVVDRVGAEVQTAL